MLKSHCRIFHHYPGVYFRVYGTFYGVYSKLFLLHNPFTLYPGKYILVLFIFTRIFTMTCITDVSHVTVTSVVVLLLNAYVSETAPKTALQTSLHCLHFKSKIKTILENEARKERFFVCLTNRLSCWCSSFEVRRFLLPLWINSFGSCKWKTYQLRIHVLCPNISFCCYYYFRF